MNAPRCQVLIYVSMLMSNPCCAQTVCARRKKNTCLCSWAGLVGGQVYETAATIRGKKTRQAPNFNTVRAVKARCHDVVRAAVAEEAQHATLVVLLHRAAGAVLVRDGEHGDMDWRLHRAHQREDGLLGRVGRR